MVLVLAGCSSDGTLSVQSGSNTKGSSGMVTVTDVLEKGIKEESSSISNNVKSKDNTELESSDSKSGNLSTSSINVLKAPTKGANVSMSDKSEAAIDVDLTKMTSTLVYSEVYNKDFSKLNIEY